MKSVLVPAALAAVLAAAPALAQRPGDAQPVDTAQAEPPKPVTSVTVDTTVRETPTATVETTTEVIAPVATRPALDPENPIAPEVQALVNAKPNYTTKDIAAAQLAAVLATPPAMPTTTVTTTRTTPKGG